MFPTLDMYLRGEDLRNCPMTQAGREMAKRGMWHRDCNTAWREDKQNFEECFRVREKVIGELYNSIKDNGYNGSPIVVRFDKEGKIHLYDGQHRVSIMKYLGIQDDLNIQAGWGNNDWDFPLVETLLKVDRKGKQTYQPVIDNRVKDFPIDRQDSLARLDYILMHLVGKTVLDVGCSEGYFSTELAKRGYEVTAIDADSDKAAITRYLSIINNLDITCSHGYWEDLLDSKHYDNILYLSVFHNTLATNGEEKAYSGLRRLAGRAKRVFFEYPKTNEYYWKDHYRDFPINGFTGTEFKKGVELNTEMKVINEWCNYRPMLLLGGNGKTSSKRTPRSVSLEKWKEHSEWERKWWYGCVNTFDEQLKQEQIYVPYMKLNQFAAHRKFFDLKGMSVLDMGGGPVSLLLRCYNFKRAVVVDPCDYPKWVTERYKQANIEYIKEMGETAEFSGSKFDEVWIYNVLQHVQNSVKVIETAKKYGKKIRVFENLEIGIYKGHPHNLTREALDEAFGKEGLVDNKGNGQIWYYGVFRYE